MHWVGLTDLTWEGYTPLALVNQDLAALFVKTNSPHKTAKDLFAHIKANPGKVGGVGHGAGRKLARRARRPDGTRRPFAELDPLGALDRRRDGVDRSRGWRRRVRVGLDAGGEALIKAGRIRPLVFMSPKRAANFPDVPTTEEALGKKWHKGVWRGFAAPKGLPKEIATQYETAIKKVWDSAEFQEFMNKRGFDLVYADRRSSRSS